MKANDIRAKTLAASKMLLPDILKKIEDAANKGKDNIMIHRNEYPSETVKLDIENELEERGFRIDSLVHTNIYW